MIRFDQVTRRYSAEDKPALEDVSVEFLRGDFVFLIGASGSGKSTLLRMILREGLPSGGKLTVAGQNLSLMLERRVPEYRRSVGMVFQDFRLLPDKTVYQNVAFALRVIGAKRGRVREQVMTTLKRVGLDHLSRRYPHEISGGEQQRAAIARAVVNKPAILLADEPTGNLDPHASEEVMKILRWINESGTTVVMATHDRAIVDNMRRRVVQLHRGKLVRDEQQGNYDPPEGSEAWEALVAEEKTSGLRAEDPNPTRPAAVAVFSTDSAEQKEAAPVADSASSPEEPVDGEPDVPEETDLAVTPAPLTAEAEVPTESDPEPDLEPDTEPTRSVESPPKQARKKPTETGAKASETKPLFGGAAAEHRASAPSAETPEQQVERPDPAAAAEDPDDQPPPPPAPRPRASAGAAGYQQARRTEEQVAASKKRKLFGFGRKP